MLSSRLVRFGGVVPRGSKLGIQLRAFSVSSVDRSSEPRSLLSKLWVPTGGMTATEDETGHGKLIRAGFLRQAHSGIFQLLPLGFKVQDKIEKLVDKHMHSIGASKLALSTISSEELWKKSGRLDSISSELFRFSDRKEASLILSPTHEEEITSLVASTLKSYKDLPIRLYQTTRKYRDERRPRHGLLRSREFLMKDLYTFDLTTGAALSTYKEVSAAYNAFFSELKIPFMVAEASSGDMGGDLSHEYHFPSDAGEDVVFHCKGCGYTANDEVATARPASDTPKFFRAKDFRVWRGITKDRKTLINAWYPRSETHELNLHALKKIIPDLDPTFEAPLTLWEEALQRENPHVINVIDGQVADAFPSVKGRLHFLPGGPQRHKAEDGHEAHPPKVKHSFVDRSSEGGRLNIVRIQTGDECPKCQADSLKAHRALEVGHTFHLGTRYSAPLNASVTLPPGGLPGAAAEGLVPESRVPVQMGCHGVGVSRIFGAVAEILADKRGLNWPRAIAPFEVVIVPNDSCREDALKVHDALAGRVGSEVNLDVVVDDRSLSFAWKLKDADLIGYPIIVIMGKEYAKGEGKCEVQCRRLSYTQTVHMDSLPAAVADLLSKL